MFAFLDKFLKAFFLFLLGARIINCFLNTKSYESKKYILKLYALQKHMFFVLRMCNNFFFPISFCVNFLVCLA